MPQCTFLIFYFPLALQHDFPQGMKFGERADYQPHSSTLKLGKENVELSTNYKDDFTFKSQSKLKSYAPLPTFIRPGVKMDSSTEANDQFKGRNNFGLCYYYEWFDHKPANYTGFSLYKALRCNTIIILNLLVVFSCITTIVRIITLLCVTILMM